MRKIIWSSIAAVLVLVGGAGPKAEAKDSILVFATADLREVLPELAEDFKKQQGIQVSFNFAGSRNLRAQLDRRLPADLLIVPDRAVIEQLLTQGVLDSRASVQLLENRLVVATSENLEEEINSLFDLKFEAGDYFALADSTTDAAGFYAEQALKKAGIYEKLKPRMIPALDVRAAMALLERGETKYAIIYSTDVKAAQHLKNCYQIPSRLYDRIIYTAAMIKKGKHDQAALKFLAYLQSEHSRIVFERYGFYRLSQ